MEKRRQSRALALRSTLSLFARDFWFTNSIKLMKKNILSIASVALIIAALAWFTNIKTENDAPAAAASSASAGVLAVEGDSKYDFGAISMAAGVVSRDFTIKNTGAAPVTIGKMYTSCMCTEASLLLGGKTFGPYGMPGHAAIPALNKNIAPGDTALVSVVFDPAAHGPAGVGRIARSVTIEQNGGRPIELQFSALVKP